MEKVVISGAVMVIVPPEFSPTDVSAGKLNDVSIANEHVIFEPITLKLVTVTLVHNGAVGWNAPFVRVVKAGRFKSVNTVKVVTIDWMVVKLVAIKLVIDEKVIVIFPVIVINAGRFKVTTIDIDGERFPRTYVNAVAFIVEKLPGPKFPPTYSNKFALIVTPDLPDGVNAPLMYFNAGKDSVDGEARLTKRAVKLPLICINESAVNDANPCMLYVSPLLKFCIPPKFKLVNPGSGNKPSKVAVNILGL